jgi:hypothetical protein
MVRATIVVADTGEMVGEFEFDQLPRNDSVTIPWPEDEGGLRILDVAEVIHVAAGAPSDWGTGPRTILRASGIPLTGQTELSVDLAFPFPS